MDGYHLPKGRLTDEELKRRGAPHTFDSESFRRDLVSLRRNRMGSFPSFHHEKKDPIPNDIKVERDRSPVIVEGNYLLLQAWGLADLFDFKIFLDCDIDLAMERVRNRLFDYEIVPTREAAAHQVETNDRLNARLVIEDGAETRADVTIGNRV
jgi:pantothenate kinase